MQYTFVQKQYAHARYSIAGECDEFLCVRANSDEMLILSAVELATVPNVVLLITNDAKVRRKDFTPVPITVMCEISNMQEDAFYGA